MKKFLVFLAEFRIWGADLSEEDVENQENISNQDYSKESEVASQPISETNTSKEIQTEENSSKEDVAQEDESTLKESEETDTTEEETTEEETTETYVETEKSTFLTDSGTLTDNDGAEATWDSTTGTLTIISEGTNTDYPWKSITNEVQKVVFRDEITTIKESVLKNFDVVEEITLGSGVTTIEKNAFSGCTSLATVNLPSGLKKIGDSAFYGCTNLAITLNGNEITSVGESAFYGCERIGGTLYLPKLTSIGIDAFRDCKNITTVSLPEITTISGDDVNYYGTRGRGAFKGCAKLESVSIPKATEISPHAFADCVSLTEIDLPEVTTIGKRAFSLCTALEKVTVSGAATIGDEAFYGCSQLKTATLSKTTSIGSNAFNGCEALDKVDLTKVTKIGENAFNGCKSLQTVSLPAITTIGKSAFVGCTTLSDLTLSEALTTIESSAFSGCESLENVTWNATKLSKINDSAFYGCKKLKTIDLPAVTSIGENAFYGCESVGGTLYLPKLTSIGIDAFRNCKNITTVNLPEITTISGDDVNYYGIRGRGAFKGCTNLKSVSIPKATEISPHAFADCVSLTEIDLPEVTTIGKRAFSLCTKLEKATLSAVISLGDEAFYGCESLTELTLNAKLGSIGASAFENCIAITALNNLPTSLISIGNYAFKGCTSLKDVTFPDKLTTIGQEAFRGCTKLANVSFPDSLTTIGQQAFYGCTSYTDITIGTSVSTIGSNAFGGVKDLKTKLTTENEVAKNYDWKGSGRYFYDLKVYDKYVDNDNETVLREWVKIPYIDGQDYTYNALDTSKMKYQYYELTSDKKTVSGTAKEDTDITFTYELVKYNINVYDDVKTFDKYDTDGETIIWKTTGTKRLEDTQKRYTNYSYNALTDGNYALYVLESEATQSGELLGDVDVVFTYQDASSIPGTDVQEHYVTVIDEFYDQNGNVNQVERSKEKYREGLTCSFTALSSDELLKATGTANYVLNGASTVSVEIGKDDQTVTFKYIYTKSTVTVTVKDVYYDINGNIVRSSTRDTDGGEYLKGTELSFAAQGRKVALDKKNYILEGDETVRVVVGDCDQTVVFSYKYELEPIQAPVVSYNIEDATVTYVDAIKAKKNNAKQTPSPSKVVLNGKTLKKNTDYTVTYQNESGEDVDYLTESGNYKIILTGTESTAKGKTYYTGVKVLDITVMENDVISMNTVKVAVNNVNYTGNEITEGIIKSVKSGKTVLEEGTHYTVDYSDTVNSGKRTITLTAVKGSGFVGTKTVTVNVKGTAMSKVKVDGITAVDFNGTGNLQQDVYDLVLTDKSTGAELTLDEDYTISYENNNKAGTAKIIFTGIGRYNGTLKKSFKINKAKLASIVNKQTEINREYLEIDNEDSLTAVADKKKGAKPEITVSYNGVELKLGTDYTLSYKNNKADAATVANWATQKKPKYPQVTITGKGNYQGKITLNFEITDK